MITKKEAGTVNGKAVAQYTLENENGLAMTFYTYGGIIQSLLVKDRQGIARDVELARRVCKMDDQVDAMFSKIVLEVCGTITENPQSVMKEVDLMFITKYIERMGDHATNIAEWVVYMETGVHPDLNDGRI